MPNVAETLVVIVVAAASLFAWALGLLQTAETLRRRRTPRRGGWVVLPDAPARRLPTDAEIEARVTQLAAVGMLPPGWSRRDAARLMRVHAGRARFEIAEHRSSAA